jgi:RES domain-containing protein
LSVLETLVHATPQELVDFRLHVADLPTRHIIEVETATLPDGWDRPVPPVSTRAIGDRWLMGATSAGLRVPSSLVPGWNVLLNPEHEEFSRLEVLEGPLKVNLPSRL